MSIQLWDWLEDLNWLVGADFPEADEDALWRCSDAWASAASGVRELAPEASALGDRVLTSLGGDSGTAFAQLWQQYTGSDGLLERAAALCEDLAAACDHAAVEVEYAKLQYIAALTLLGATLAALTAALVAGGLSALGMPAAIAAAQFTIRMVLARLITAMAVGATMNVALDALAQSIQLLAGHRHDWDAGKTVAAAEDGAIYGLIGGGVFLAAARFAPALLRPAGLAVPLTATAGLGGVAAPLAHGELPTGKNFLLALSSGVAGGLGPDLVHRRSSAPDLSRLGSLDTALAGRGASPADQSTGGSPLAAGGEFAGLVHDGRHGPYRSGIDATPADVRSVDDGQSQAGVRPGESDRSTGRPDHVSTRRPEDPGQLAGDAPHVADRAEPPAAWRQPVHPAGAVDGSGLGPVPAADRPGASVRPDVAPQPLYLGPSVPAGATGAGPSASTPSGAAVAPTGAVAGTAPGPGSLAGGGPTGATVATAPSTTPAGTTIPAVGAGTIPSQAAPNPLVGPDPILAQLALAAGLRSPGAQGVNPIAVSGVDGPGWIPRDASTADLPGWSNGKQTLSGLPNLAADLLMERARAVEPRLTGLIGGIADDLGGRLLGEDNRFKTADSLKSKLALKLGPKSLAEALAATKDSLRYTIGLPEDGYAHGSRYGVDLLLDRGFRPVGEFRSWLGEPGYLGFNTFWSDPVGGHVFEVQFHTDASFLAKTESHGIFDRIREFPDGDRDSPAYLALKASHDAYYVDVRIPPGAADVRIPPDIPLHDPTADVPEVPTARSADAATTPSGGDIPATPLVRRFATDAEALALARQNVFGTRAGLGFYAAGDQVRDFARAVHATDGFVTLDLHGSARGFQIGNLRLTPDQFADALLQLRADGVLRLPDGVGIKLLSCDTGVGGPNSPAAVLARRLGVEVFAPDQPVWTALNGDEVVSSPAVVGGRFVPTDPPDGTWLRFTPVAPASTTAPGAVPASPEAGPRSGPNAARDGPSG